MFSYKHPLTLSSPLMHGDRVLHAQHVLKDHGYYHAHLDGQWGEQCMHSTKDAKFWLGYPKRKITGHFGETLYLYLLGKKRRTPYMVWLARHRKKEAAKRAKTGGLHRKAITLAAHYIGVKEVPFGSNRTPFGVWYGMNGVPWCAIFQSFDLCHCGRNFRYSYVPAIVSDARLGRNKLRTIPFTQVEAAIKAGHVVLACFDWTHDGEADHVGQVESVGVTSFQTIEGNTGDTNFSNGGEVMRATRYPSQVQAFVLVYS